MENKQWLTINYTLPREPSRVRVGVWRKLKKRGAVILGQSVWILPVSGDNEAFLRGLSDEILRRGGTAYVTRMIPQDADTADRMTAAFDGARNEEYNELLEQCGELIRELETESGRGKYTFAELEENENRLRRLTDWRREIARRDFHGASLRAGADAMLEQCRARLHAFAAEVYRRNDTPD